MLGPQFKYYIENEPLLVISNMTLNILIRVTGGTITAGKAQADPGHLISSSFLFIGRLTLQCNFLLRIMCCHSSCGMNVVVIVTEFV